MNENIFEYKNPKAGWNSFPHVKFWTLIFNYTKSNKNCENELFDIRANYEEIWTGFYTNIAEKKTDKSKNKK